MKKTLLALLTMLVIINAIPLVNAALFNVGATICAPSWYCTGYSQGNCGDRTCIDVNMCGINLNKPSEYIACQSISSSGGVSGGSSGGEGATVDLQPQTPFTISTDSIKLTVEQEKVIQKIIIINSSAPEDYILEIQYPSSYTKGTDLLTTTSNNKHIEQAGDFNIIIDTRSILVGTYVIPVRIYNKDYSKTVSVIIDVVPKNNPNIELKIDSPLKIYGVDKELKIELDVADVKLNRGDVVTYEVIDPKGNIISQQGGTVENSSKIKDDILLPSDIGEGYYTLSTKIESASGTYTKSTTFTILTPNKYAPIIEKPSKTNYITIIIIAILIIIGTLIILFNTNLLYKKNKFDKRHKYSKGITMFKLFMAKPIIQINLGTGEGIKKVSEKFRKNKLVTDPDKKLDLLKRSYEKGFISLKEYRDSLKYQGFIVESDKVAEYYDDLKNKERVEGISKHAFEDNESDKAKYVEALKVKEEQREEMEKAEKTLLRQEEELKKEIENERELKEKKLEEEKLKEKEVKEKEIKEEIKEIKTEVEEARETLNEKTSDDTPKYTLETKVILTPLSHSIFKENVLDKRINDSQAFTLNSGERLYCIRDLLNILSHIHEQVFNYHTKHGRNDFANWIGDVFQYYDVAEAIRATDSKEEMIKELKKLE